MSFCANSRLTAKKKNTDRINPQVIYALKKSTACQKGEEARRREIERVARESKRETGIMDFRWSIIMISPESPMRRRVVVVFFFGGQQEAPESPRDLTFVFIGASDRLFTLTNYVIAATLNGS